MTLKAHHLSHLLWDNKTKKNNSINIKIEIEKAILRALPEKSVNTPTIEGKSP